MLLSSEDSESFNRTECKDRLPSRAVRPAITFEKSSFAIFCRNSAGMYSSCAYAKGQLITSVNHSLHI